MPIDSVHTLKPADACQWSGSSLDQIMARHLFSDPLVTCQMDPGTQTSEKIWIKMQWFPYKKIWFQNIVCKWQWFCLDHFVSGLNMLTFNVQGPSYLGLTRSISWLLMAWLLTSPGHQQPWYWLYKICRSWSYLRKDFKYLCHINVE